MKTHFIKQNSDLATLKYPITWDILKRYDISEKMMENVAVTFSMVNAETDIFKVANSAGDLVINEDVSDGLNLDDSKYSLVYCFKLRDTKKAGHFKGEFVIDFLDEDAGLGKIKFPLVGHIDIVIGGSITNTTVI